LMQAKLAELAALVGGTVAGDGDLSLTGAAPLCDARSGEITLLDGTEKCQHQIVCNASAAVAPRGFRLGRLPILETDNVHSAFAQIICYFRPASVARRIGISPLAVVSPSARIAPEVDIHPFVTIGDDVTIGSGSTIHSGVHIMAGSQIAENVTIFPNTVLYENTIVGPRCIIHANAVLGAYGFGYTIVEGRHQLSAQLGNVVLGSDVEVGAGSTIDRGTYGSTVVGEGTKIDDQVMVAHNCRIGRHNMLCSQVGIAGSTSTGDYVVMAGQVGVRDHVRIGSGVVLGAKTGVSSDVPANQRWFGLPAKPEREQRLIWATFNKLPEMRRSFKKLQRLVAKLVAEAGSPQLRALLPDDEADGAQRREAA
jgi:UDP-3-O-[3-hydroxymyristoyl] glucosamine N-acyltransferase